MWFKLMIVPEQNDSGTFATCCGTRIDTFQNEFFFIENSISLLVTSELTTLGASPAKVIVPPTNLGKIASVVCPQFAVT